MYLTDLLCQLFKQQCNKLLGLLAKISFIFASEEIILIVSILTYLEEDIILKGNSRH